MEQNPNRRWVSIALTCASAAAGLAGMGCEDQRARADRELRQVIARSERMADQAEAIALLSNVATPEVTQAASPAIVADMKHQLGHNSYTRAVALLPQLNSRETEAQALMRDITRLGGRIFNNNQMMAFYKAQDPAGAAASQPLKTLAAAKARLTARIAELDTQAAQIDARLKALTADIAKLKGDHDAAAAEATRLLAQAEQAQGEQSLAIFRASLDARGKANNLSRAIELAGAEVARLREAEAGIKTSRQVAQESIANIQKQVTALNQGWAAVQSLIKARQEAGAKLVTESGLEANAKKVAAAMAEASQLRAQADKLLDEAINHYEQAAVAAGKLDAQIQGKLNEEKNRTAPERIAWKQIQATHRPTGYRLAKARALQARGNLYAAELGVLRTQQRLVDYLTPIFKDAGLTVPPELANPNLKQLANEAAKSARGYFDAAENILRDVVDRGELQEISEARMLRMSNLYAMYGLTNNAKLLAEAQRMLTEIVNSTGEGAAPVELPVLPTDLQGNIVKRTAVDVNAPPKPVTTPTQPEVEKAPAGPSRQGQAWRNLLRRGGDAFGQGGQAQPPQPQQ